MPLLPDFIEEVKFSQRISVKNLLLFHHPRLFQLGAFPTLFPKSSDNVHHIPEYGLKERSSITEKFLEPKQFMDSRKQTNIWKLLPHQNPRLCRYSSCLTHKLDTSMDTSLRPDQKTPFSRKSFNGGVNTAPMHPSV